MSIDYNPLVSVILPVYNGQPYLTTALESLRSQTYNNFEIIVINDGSTDNSIDIINSFELPNMRVFSRENHGLAATLNRGIELSQGKLIARMDQDDVSEPDRLDKQVEFFALHPEIGVAGTGYKLIDTQGNTLGLRQPPCCPREIERRLFVGNALVHGSVMFRRELIEQAGNYSVSEKLEDYHLWSRLIGIIQMANLPNILYGYRYNVPGSMVDQNFRQYNLEKNRLRDELWKRSFPPVPWGDFQSIDNRFRQISRVRAYLDSTAKFSKNKFNRSEREYYLLTSLGIAREAVQRQHRSIAIREYITALLTHWGDFLITAKIIRHMFTSLIGNR